MSNNENNDLGIPVNVPKDLKHLDMSMKDLISSQPKKNVALQATENTSTSEKISKNSKKKKSKITTLVMPDSLHDALSEHFDDMGIMSFSEGCRRILKDYAKKNDLLK